MTTSPATPSRSPIPDPIAAAVMDCLEKLPVIVLGSGASIPHGIPGMAEIQEHLLTSVQLENSKEESDPWLLVRTAMANGDDLETALSKAQLPDSLIRRIVAATWTLIADADNKVLDEIAVGNRELPLTRLLRWFARSTHHEVPVVTTNYDRLAEYAADAAGLLHLNGFAPGYLRSRESVTYEIKRNKRSPRTLRLWKVHGSLDWFERKRSEIVCVRFTRQHPVDLRPVIVTPGVAKHQETHKEPFRSIISGADRALESAAAVFCIGYGFRDAHIEPKLVDRCRDYNIPLIILAKALTDQARSFLKKAAGKNFVAFEDCDVGTRAVTHQDPNGQELPGVRLWELENFLDHFIPSQEQTDDI